MKSLYALNSIRRTDRAVVEMYGNTGDDKTGVFELPSPADQESMIVIASNDAGWDHVSVSRADRCPTWEEMEHVKHLFFKPEETAMQLHVPQTDHINCHPHCLHLWRPHLVKIPRPPAEFVGPVAVGVK